MRLEDIVHRLHTRSQKDVLVPTPALQKTIDDSHIGDLISRLETLEETLETEERIIEKGKRMTITLKFNQLHETHSQVVISITEKAISFSGDVSTNQYIRLEGDDIGDTALVEDALTRTCSNPLTVNGGNTHSMQV